MFGFSRKTDYALLILTALAGRGRDFVSVRALARAHRLPYRFASQIVGLLTHAGILEAREGARGGYRLAKEPRDITVQEVLRATEAGAALVPCLDPRKHRACPQKSWCGARWGMNVLQRDVQRTFARYTVADFARAAVGRSHA